MTKISALYISPDQTINQYPPTETGGDIVEDGLDLTEDGEEREEVVAMNDVIVANTLQIEGESVIIHQEGVIPLPSGCIFLLQEEVLSGRYGIPPAAGKSPHLHQIHENQKLLQAIFTTLQPGRTFLPGIRCICFK